MDRMVTQEVEMGGSVAACSSTLSRGSGWAPSEWVALFLRVPSRPKLPPGAP